MSAVEDTRRGRSRRTGPRRAALPLAAGMAALVVTGSVTAPAVAATAVVTSVAPPAAATAAVAPPALRTVAYAGVRLSVPAAWPVVDLDRTPTACVRFDVHAVYLGSAGPDQSCPARVVGRTETVWIAPSGTTGVTSMAATPGTVPAAAVDDLAQQLTIDPVGTGTTVTATWGTDQGTARRIAASAHRTGVVAVRPRPTAAGVATRFPDGASATRATGYGFDACAAPSAAAMRAWRASSYSTVGIYIGGRNRGCAQPNLTTSWMGQVVGLAGWRALPIYVGRQAPCIGRSSLALIDPATAGSQGASEARDAIGDARSIGLQPGSTLYNDIEGYPTGGACTRAVLTYLSAWTDTLHGYGFLSGVYSSASGGIADLARDPIGGTYTDPDAVWSARWDNRTALFGEPYIPDSRWTTQQRVKQYRGDHRERWGGYTINIDSNVLDAVVGTIGYRGVVREWVLPRLAANNGARAYGTLGPGRVFHTSCVSLGGVYRGSNRWLRLLDGRFVPEAATTRVTAVPLCSLPTPTLVDLHLRRAPSPAGTPLGVLRKGALAPVMCQGVGSLAAGSRVWDKLTSGAWVADGFLASPGRPGYSAGYPRC